MERDTDRSKIKGFTLVEVILAVLILALGLVTLFGLNTSVMSASLENSRRYQATLFARAIMTALESSSNKVDTISLNDGAYSVLQSILQQTPPIDAELMNGYTAELQIQPWKIAGVDYDGLYLAELKVLWGDRQEQSVKTSLILPASDNE